MMNINGSKNTAVSEVVVVGGGLAGLATAVLLAQAGRPVTVVEKARTVGGRARSQQRGDFCFNLGPHALYVSGPAAALLAELGVPLAGDVPRFGRTAVAMLDSRMHLLPFAPVTILTTKLFTFREKLALGRLLAAIMKTRPEDVAQLTVREWVNSQTESSALRRLLFTFNRVATYTNAPDQLSAAVFLHQMQLSLKGNVRYLDGGWQSLVDGLRQRAERAGVRILTGAQVTAVHDHALHLASGSVLTAGQIVLAVDPAAAAGLVPDNPDLAHWAAAAVPVQAATLDLALRRLPRADRLFALDMERPLYFSVHSAFADLAPADTALIHAAKYLPAGQPAAVAADLAELEAFMDLLQPGWREAVIEKRFLPHTTVVNRLATAVTGGLNGRPQTRLPGSDHIFLAGDWIGPVGWLADASLASARQAATCILASQSVSLPAGQPLKALAG